MITQFVWTTYICFLTVIPLLLEWGLFRKVVTHLGYQWSMSYGIPADLGVVSLAFACLYTFVIPDLVVRTTALFHPSLSERLKLGFQHLQQLFPAFAVSVYLIYANTNIHTWHSKAFILIQMVLFIYLPFSFCCSNDTITVIAYRCVLAWSLIYSLFPHEVSNAFWYMTQLHGPSSGYYYVL